MSTNQKTVSLRSALESNLVPMLEWVARFDHLRRFLLKELAQGVAVSAAS